MDKDLVHMYLDECYLVIIPEVKLHELMYKALQFLTTSCIQRTAVLVTPYYLVPGSSPPHLNVVSWNESHLDEIFGELRHHSFTHCNQPLVFLYCHNIGRLRKCKVIK